MLTLWEKFVFSFIILATAAAFLHPIIRRYRIVRAGRPDPRLDEVIASVRREIGGGFVPLLPDHAPGRAPGQGLRGHPGQGHHPDHRRGHALVRQESFERGDGAVDVLVVAEILILPVS